MNSRKVEGLKGRKVEVLNIAVLMTCYNRRGTTLRCLASLRDEWENSGSGGRSGSGTWEWDNGWLDVFLVDDGSTDGTSAAVREWERKMGVRVESGSEKWEGDNGRFFVRLIQGDGSLYWAKGMSRAWRTAVATVGEKSGSGTEEGQFHSPTPTPTHISHYDGFLWLNDDTLLHAGTMRRLEQAIRDNPDAVIVGSLRDVDTGKKTCGLKSDGTFTGNFTYVPLSVYEKVGMLCGDFAHAWADSDYALRCRRAGVKVVELENVGTTRAHDLRPSLKGKTLSERIRLLRDPKGWCVHDLWLYRRRNWGMLVAIWSCIHLILHVLVGEMNNE